MKKLFLFPLLLALGCSASPPPPAQGPSNGFPEPDRVMVSKPVDGMCIVGFNSLIETDFKCTFHNGNDDVVASSCFNVVVLRRFQQEYVMTLHPFCSGGIAPNDTVNKIYEIRSLEHTKLSHGCGRDLSTCYMRLDRVKTSN